MGNGHILIPKILIHHFLSLTRTLKFSGNKSVGGKKMSKKKERASKGIDKIEADAVAVDEKTEGGGSEADSWGEREEDSFSEDDREQSVTLYRLGIGNDPGEPEAINPMYRKLCLDRDGKIEPRKLIRAIVLERRRPRTAQVAFKNRDKLPADDPFAKYIGHSHDGKRPAMDVDGNFLKLCACNEGVPFARCSSRSTFDDGEVVVKELGVDEFTFERDGVSVKGIGECCWGRWGNSMTESDREKYGIPEDEGPKCPESIAMYFWDLDKLIPFVGYFKVSSLRTAEGFLSSCVEGVGSDAKKLPWHAFECHITVQDKGNYAIPSLMNTLKKTEKNEVAPIVKWWESKRGGLIRPLSDIICDFKKKKKKEEEFDPSKL
jgi:hypothetical protein